jgi:hypothetical protein
VAYMPHISQMDDHFAEDIKLHRNVRIPCSTLCIILQLESHFLKPPFFAPDHKL